MVRNKQKMTDLDTRVLPFTLDGNDSRIVFSTAIKRGCYQHQARCPKRDNLYLLGDSISLHHATLLVCMPQNPVEPQTNDLANQLQVELITTGKYHSLGYENGFIQDDSRQEVDRIILHNGGVLGLVKTVNVVDNVQIVYPKFRFQIFLEREESNPGNGSDTNRYLLIMRDITAVTQNVNTVHESYPIGYDRRQSQSTITLYLSPSLVVPSLDKKRSIEEDLVKDQIARKRLKLCETRPQEDNHTIQMLVTGLVGITVGSLSTIFFLASLAEEN